MKPMMTLILAVVWTLAACGGADPGEEARDPTLYLVLVNARLASDDPEVNRETHDLVAGAGQEAARSMGDIAHKVVLGVEDPREFLAIDIWNDLEGLQAFMSDPEIQEGFGRTFEAPPQVAVYEIVEGAVEWGELELKMSTILVTVQGNLVGACDQENIVRHNQVAEGGREAAQALGDVAHLVYLGVEDSRQFLAVDLWESAEGLQQFFSDAEVQAAFGSLFTEPPAIRLYRSCDYLQW